MDFKNTVFLPKTDFPMKASLSSREPDYLAYWKEINLFEKLRDQSKGREKFILHYGPPYANGHIHIGHALTEILKDIINKTYQMKGYDAPMVPGWDCHGLPIEWTVEKKYQASGINKDDVNVLEFREECRSYAKKWIEIQKEEFIRLGIVADWENPYITMDFSAEAAIVEQLGHFLMNGTLYRGLRPVMWSVVEKTALAEMEVEYKDHTSDSIFVKFPIIKTSTDALQGVFALIWTTTPWTLPGNRAISYGPEFTYAVILNTDTNDKFLVAEDLIPSIQEATGMMSIQILTTIPGSDLKDVICAHPLASNGYDFDVPLIAGDHVTIDAGTGLVHTAPGHGIEDFDVCKIYGIPVPETVGPDGIYYPQVPLLAGHHVYKANPIVIEHLKTAGHLLHAAKLIHSYPHSWRSKAPLIYRATAQWFVSMEKNKLREKSLQAISDTQWFPAASQNRIRTMVEGRPDWCLSRQRAWGTPLTIFVHKETGEVLRDAAVHARIVDAIRQEGGDAWITSPAERFLGDSYKAEDYEKVHDILDVWFDSGCTHEFVLRQRPDQQWPADLYLEGSDQHRGWFQSSLLESCGVHGVAPYKKVLTHGFTLDEKGYKMSKSLGNVVAPEEIIKKIGADILRLWVTSVDYSDDMRIGPEILKQQEDFYRRLRNTLRYLLGALEGFDEVTETVSYDDMPDLEKWVLNRLYQLNELHEESLKSFDFTNFYATLHHFCSQDLSAFYFDIRKDCLYCDSKSSIKRRSTRTVMNFVFEHLIHWLAPVLSFTAEEAFVTRHGMKGDSIHLQTFPQPDAKWKNLNIDQTWSQLRDIRRVMTGALEIERASKTIGSSLQACLAVYVPQEIAKMLKDVDLAELSITSDVMLLIAACPPQAFTLEEVLDVGVIVNQAKGEKCQRCWRILPEVAKHEHHICHRCDDAVKD